MAAIKTYFKVKNSLTYKDRNGQIGEAVFFGDNFVTILKFDDGKKFTFFSSEIEAINMPVVEILS